MTMSSGYRPTSLPEGDGFPLRFWGGVEDAVSGVLGTVMGMSQPAAAPLLREFIEIPERTSTSDFVLKLADSVTDADADACATTSSPTGWSANFDEALGLIKSALEGHASKAAYLHGSLRLR